MTKDVETLGWKVYLYELIQVCAQNHEVHINKEGINVLLKAIEKDIAKAEEELMYCISEEIKKMSSSHPKTDLNKDIQND